MVELFTDCKQLDCEHYNKSKKVCELPPGAECPEKTTKPNNKKVKEFWNQKHKGFKIGGKDGK